MVADIHNKSLVPNNQQDHIVNFLVKKFCHVDMFVQINVEMNTRKRVLFLRLSRCRASMMQQVYVGKRKKHFVQCRVKPFSVVGIFAEENVETVIITEFISSVKAHVSVYLCVNTSAWSHVTAVIFVNGLVQIDARTANVSDRVVNHALHVKKSVHGNVHIMHAQENAVNLAIVHPVTDLVQNCLNANTSASDFAANHVRHYAECATEIK